LSLISLLPKKKKEGTGAAQHSKAKHSIEENKSLTWKLEFNYPATGAMRVNCQPRMPPVAPAPQLATTQLLPISGMRKLPLLWLHFSCVYIRILGVYSSALNHWQL